MAASLWERVATRPFLQTLFARNLLLAGGLGGGVLALASNASFFWAHLTTGHLDSVDFIADYTAARIVTRTGLRTLYDLHLQAAVQAPIAHANWGGQHTLLAFVNPPYVALLVSPLAHLGFAGAFLTWTALNLAATTAGLAAVICTLNLRPAARATLLVLCLAWVPTLVVMLQGQADGLCLLGLGLAYRTLRAGNSGRAGIALSLTLVKPHLILLLPLIFLIRRDWRLLAGLAASATILVAVTAALDWQVWGQYVHLTLMDAFQIHEGWRSGNETSLVLLGLVRGPGWVRWGLWSACAVGVLVAVRLKSRDPAQDLALAVTASLWLAPHVNYHDLALAAIPFLLMVGMVAVGRGGVLAVVAAAGVFALLEASVTLPAWTIAVSLGLWTVVWLVRPTPLLPAPELVGTGFQPVRTVTPSS